MTHPSSRLINLPDIHIGIKRLGNLMLVEFGIVLVKGIFILTKHFHLTHFSLHRTGAIRLS